MWRGHFLKFRSSKAKSVSWDSPFKSEKIYDLDVQPRVVVVYLLEDEKWVELLGHLLPVVLLGEAGEPDGGSLLQPTAQVSIHPSINNNIQSSVRDPWHFGADPNPRIRTSD